MLERFRSFIARKNLIPSNSRVLVGYSGGADSTCLLHLMSRLKLDCVAAHLHHGQRPEADDELRDCEAFARSLAMPFVSGQAHVPLLSHRLGIGIEEAGRNARYEFFNRSAEEHECTLIATAHTRSDNVETIIHHLIRGCGMNGLSGIPIQRGNIIRPLLGFDREETRAYCLAHGLGFHDDPANSDVSFSRARIRHRIVPELRSINPAAAESIARMSEAVVAENRYLNDLAAAALDSASVELNGKLGFLTDSLESAFDRDRLLSLPAVLLRRAVRLAVEKVGGDFDSHETRVLVDGLHQRSKGSVTSAGGRVVVEWMERQVGVRALLVSAVPRRFLEVPGGLSLSDHNWRLEALTKKPSGAPVLRADLTAELDEAHLAGTLYIRPAQSGDRMQPLGFTGRRKMSDLFGEAKLSPAARLRVPIICDMKGPIWIPGVCLDERARKRESTRSVLFLRFGPVDSPGGHNEETPPGRRA